MTTTHDGTWWRHLSGWRHQASARGAVLAALPAMLLLAAAPAGAAAATGSGPTAPFAGPDSGPTATAVRVLLVAATTVLAGTGLARLLVPLSVVAGPARRTAWIAAVVAGAAAVVTVPAGLATPWVATVQVILTFAVAVALPWASVVAPATLGLTALLAVEVAASGGGGAVFVVIYTVGAALLSGASVLAMTTGGEDPESRTRRAAHRRLGRVAVGAGGAVTAAAAAHVVVAGPHTLVDLVHTVFGIATLLALVLPPLVTFAWVLARRRALRPDGAARLAVVGAAVAISAVSVLATLPSPASAPIPGQPLLRPVTLAGEQLSLLVTPGLPGPNLVRLSGGPATAAPGQAGEQGAHGGPSHHPGFGTGSGALSISAGGGEPVPITPRAGASGGWAVLDIPAGTRRLTVSQGALSVPVPADVGTRAGTAEQQAAQTSLSGPDGPECADAVLGALLADAAAVPAGCPAQRLGAADAESLRVVLDSLAAGGLRSLVIAQDTSPRSVAAAELVRTEAQRRQIQVSTELEADSAVLVVSGWASAVDTLRDLGERAAVAPVATGGTYLAPWLLTANVINTASSSVLPLRFNPQEVGPRQYAATLASVFPDAAPSQAGYASWEQATHSVRDHRVTLYSAAPVHVPMGMARHGSGGPGKWFPGGAIVPISLPRTGS